MSQSKFSAYFGIPTATLQDWEHKRRTPPPYIIGMMARILELEKELSEKG
ncbi:transcriptional regulator [Falcatimonas sp. MSJ-15]|nr:transcriptional regulator [Falcatimonas sp. MSJ-15]